jgi:hypothetical protein
MDTPRVFLAPLPFGRFHILVEHAGATYENFLLFTKETKSEGESLIAKILSAMSEEDNPLDALTMTLWNDGSKENFKKKFYTSVAEKLNARGHFKGDSLDQTRAEVARRMGRDYRSMSNEERDLFDVMYTYLDQTVFGLKHSLQIS